MTTYHCNPNGLTYNSVALPDLNITLGATSVTFASTAITPSLVVSCTPSAANSMATYTGSFGTITSDAGMNINFTLSGVFAGSSIGSLYGVPYVDYLAPGTYNCSTYLLTNISTLQVTVNQDASVGITVDGTTYSATKNGSNYVANGSTYNLYYYNNGGTDLLYGVVVGITNGAVAGCFTGYAGSIPSAVMIQTDNGVRLKDADLSIASNNNSYQITGNASAVTRFTNFSELPPNIAPIKMLINQVVTDLRSKVQTITNSNELAGITQLNDLLTNNTDLATLLTTLGQIQSIANTINGTSLPSNQIVFQPTQAEPGQTNKLLLKTVAGDSLFNVYTY